MKLYKSLCSILLFAFVMLVPAFNAQSQDCDIKFETKAINPETGKKNGSIQIVFGDSSKKYKVFLLNTGSDQAKKEIQNGIIENLQKGFYDIIIIDDNGCNKQFTVNLK